MYQPYPEESISWQGRLGQSTSEAEVMEVAREFLATVSPYDISGLPKGLLPPKLTDASDISAYAFELVRHDVQVNPGAHRGLHRLATFFSRAATRLSQIFAPHGRMFVQPAQGGRNQA